MQNIQLPVTTNFIQTQPNLRQSLDQSQGISVSVNVGESKIIKDIHISREENVEQKQVDSYTICVNVENVLPVISRVDQNYYSSDLTYAAWGLPLNFDFNDLKDRLNQYFIKNNESTKFGKYWLNLRDIVIKFINENPSLEQPFNLYLRELTEVYKKDKSCVINLKKKNRFISMIRNYFFARKSKQNRKERLTELEDKLNVLEHEHSILKIENEELKEKKRKLVENNQNLSEILEKKTKISPYDSRGDINAEKNSINYSVLDELDIDFFIDKCEKK